MLLKRMTKPVIRGLLLILGLIGGILLGEVLVRCLKPVAASGGILQGNFAAGRMASFQPDDECGYLPKFGDDFGAQGCHANEYPLPKTPGRKRVLFLGDSVTSRARIVNGLRQRHGPGVEYWNAGVEGFNTSQEVSLYRRYNRKIRPDLVILCFHNNDFIQTPLVYREQGKLHILTPYHDRQSINLFLFENSYLYRCYVGRGSDRDHAEKAAKMRRDLAELLGLVRQDGAELRLVLLPLMKSLKEYDWGENWSRDQIRTIADELRLPVYDLIPAMDRALTEGVSTEEVEGDYWHPNAWAADRLAEELIRQRLLD